MATIKEMAAAAYLEGNYGFDSGDWQETYLLGANAVLEEIESIIVNNEDNTLCMARCLVYKIKELKGE